MKKNYIVSSLVLLSLFTIQNMLGMAATSSSASTQDRFDLDIPSTPSVVSEQFLKEIDHYDTLELFLINKLCKERINPGVRIDEAALSPDNNLIACAGKDGFFLWNRTTRTQVQQFPKNETEHCLQVLFSDDGSRLSIVSNNHRPGYQDRRVRIWNVRTGQLVFNLQDATRLVFCPDNEHIIVGKKNAELWNIKENKKLHEFVDEFSENIRDLALAHNRLIVLKNDGYSIWDIDSKERLKTTEVHYFGVRAHWFPDAKRYVLHNWLECSVEEYDLHPDWVDGEKMPLFSHKDVGSFNLAPNGRSSLDDKQRHVSLYSIPNKETRVLQKYRAYPKQLEFSSDSKQVLIVINTNSKERINSTTKVVEGNYNPIDIIYLNELEKLDQLLRHASPQQIKLYEAFAFAIKKNARIHADQEQWKVYKSLPESIQEALKLYIKED